MLIDCVQLSPLITEEDSYDLVDKILDLGTVYSKENLEKNVRKRTDINKPESSVFQNVEIINKAISQNKKIRFRFVKATNSSEDFLIVSPKEIRSRNGVYTLIAYADKQFEAKYGVFIDYGISVKRMADIVILSQDREKTISEETNGSAFRRSIVDREQYSFDPNREYAVTILFHKADMEKVKRFFGNDLQFIPYDEDNMMVTLRTRITVSLFHSILNFGEHAKILSPKEAIGEFFVFMKTRMRELDELYGYGTSDFLKDVPTNYDDLRAQKHHFKHTRKIRRRN